MERQLEGKGVLAPSRALTNRCEERIVLRRILGVVTTEDGSTVGWDEYLSDPIRLVLRPDDDEGQRSRRSTSSRWNRETLGRALDRFSALADFPSVSMGQP
jgi:hypothetical protein